MILGFMSPMIAFIIGINSMLLNISLYILIEKYELNIINIHTFNYPYFILFMFFIFQQIIYFLFFYFNQMLGHYLFLGVSIFIDVIIVFFKIFYHCKIKDEDTKQF